MCRIVRSLCQAPRQQCCQGACQISKWYDDDSSYQSRGLETSRNIMIRRLIGYWNGALVPIAGTPAGPDCHRADIVFVVDSSGSIKQPNWRIILEFIANVTSILDIGGSQGARIGVVKYGNIAGLQVGLDCQPRLSLIFLTARKGVRPILSVSILSIGHICFCGWQMRWN